MAAALKDRRLWGILAAVAGVLAVVYLADLGAVVSPQDNTQETSRGSVTHLRTPLGGEEGLRL